MIWKYGCTGTNIVLVAMQKQGLNSPYLLFRTKLIKVYKLQLILNQMNDVNHRIWIKTIDENTFAIVITYCQTTTREIVVEGLEAVRDRIAAFKTLYDGDFEVLSDVNYF